MPLFLLYETLLSTSPSTEGVSTVPSCVVCRTAEFIGNHINNDYWLLSVAIVVGTRPSTITAVHAQLITECGKLATANGYVVVCDIPLVRRSLQSHRPEVAVIEVMPPLHELCSAS